MVDKRIYMKSVRFTILPQHVYLIFVPGKSAFLFLPHDAT